MNRNLYRTIFNKRSGALVAVAEITRAHTKGAGAGGASGGTSGGSAGAAPTAIERAGFGHLGRFSALSVLVSLAVACALWGEPAHAAPPLPTGGIITQGSGSISQSGNTLTVNQSSQNLAANWQSFDIGSGNAVVFHQPNSSSVALNRVIGPDASSIYGSLSANGKVFLVNPNGVLFAPGSQVTVGGLVASTLGISDADFASGHYRFTQGNGATGTITNEGNINAGSVALIGPQLINSGTIATPGGDTTLAAGQQVTVELMPNGLLTAQVDVAAANAQIQNHGKIVADGGSVSMQAGRADTVMDTLINTDGVIQAHSIRNENGSVYLDGGAGGTVTVSGTVDASGSGSGAHGGNITALGKNVGLMSGAQVNASGDTGGGTVLVGGNWQGSGSEQHAQATYMDSTATIHADATGNGDGGKVVLWSDQYTGFYGNISARGGAQGGNGGEVETSSHGNLQAMGIVNASAPHGTAGQHLLDPSDVTITSSTSNDSASGGNPDVFTPSSGASSSSINVASINADLNAGTSVTITTTNAGTAGIGNGDITVASSIAKTSGADATLTLNADRNIVVNPGVNIASTSGMLNITLDAHYSSDTAPGMVNISLSGGAASNINSNGGNIIIGGGSNPATTPAIGISGINRGRGVTLWDSTVNAAGGNVIINGLGASSSISTDTGEGVLFVGSSLSTSGTGAVIVTGMGSASGSAYNAVGVWFDTLGGTLQVSSGSGAITITGASGTTAGGNRAGISTQTGGTLDIFSGNGPISLIGVAASSSGTPYTNLANTRINIGWDGGSNVTTGNVSVLAQTASGSTLGANGLNLTNTVIKGNNANLAIGSTGAGAGLTGLTLSSSLIDPGSTWNNVTIGDPGTGAIVDNGSTITASGTVNFTGSSYTFNGPNSISASTVGFGNANTINNIGTLTLSDTGASNIANVIAGSGSLVKTGTGTLTLSGANTYDGTTTVNGGTLAITNASGLGSTNGGTVVNGGATLDLQNVAVGAESVTLAGAAGGYGTLTTSTGTSSLAGPITLAGPSFSYFNVASGAQLTVSGVISGSGGVYSSNAGTLVFSGTNTYSGGTQLALGSSGTLAITNNSALGAGSVNLRASTTLDLRNVTVSEQIFGNGGTLLASTGVNTISGNLTSFSNIPVDVLDGAQLTITSSMSSSSTLVKNGNGLLTLTGNNTRPGTTTINAGTVQVGNGGTTGTLGSGAVTVASGANLIFNRSDTVSLSTLASNAGGITGQGNVSALIGGGFTVDRPINLNGANSNILLEAGKNNAAGDASGGDVVLSSTVTTSATGTVTIFSGNANTAALEAQVSGATGATRYKTYDASVASTSGAVSGTRNYYYRQSPSLSVNGLTATKVYDGLLDATSVLNTSGATVAGLVDGDTLGAGSLTLTSAAFDSAHAGTRTVNATFSGPMPTYSGSGATWSVSGYSTTNLAGSGSGTIAPRPVTTSINAVGKTYDGMTDTISTLAAPAGFVGNDTATGIGGLSLAFDNPNVGTRNVVASGTGTLLGFTGTASGNGSGVGAGNEVAGLASDYAFVSPSPATAAITPALLTITANNDAKIVSQSDAPGYNGASYSGFVHGEDPTVLTGTLSITRSNAGTQAAGTYAGVLVPSGLSASNYTISYVNGDYQILPAQQLLVKISNVITAYGTSPGYTITSAEYLDGSGSSIHSLTQTAQSGNTYTYSDGLGGSVTFTVTPQGAVTSGAGYLAVGNYALSGTNTQISGNNFLGLSFVGNEAVTPIALTPLPSAGVTKVYDGTTAMTGLTLGLTGELAGDTVQVNGTGAFNSKNAGTNIGYNINSMSLLGPDAGNYYLSASAFSGANGVITPKLITVSGITANDKTYDGTRAATLTTSGSVLNGVVAGDTVAFDGTGYSALFADKNAGTAKSVAVSGLSLTGTDAGNYTLAQPTGLTASITPRPLTITAVSDTKTFDGTTSSSAIPIVSGGLADGDHFTLLGERYASALLGAGLTLVPLVGIDDGNGGDNYTLTLVDNNAGQILPGLDLAGLGASNFTSRLNGDSGSNNNPGNGNASTEGSELARTGMGACDRSGAVGSSADKRSAAPDNGHCSAGTEQGALIQVVSTGMRLPPRLAAGENPN